MKLTRKEMRKKVLRELKKQIPRFAEKTAFLYRTIGWTWGDFIPNSKKIKDTLCHFIKHMEEETENPFISSGGLCISIEDYEKDNLEGTISFTYDTKIWVDEKGKTTVSILEDGEE